MRQVILLDEDHARVRLVEPGRIPLCTHVIDGAELLLWLQAQSVVTSPVERAGEPECVVSVCGVAIDASELDDLLGVAGITYRALRSDGYTLRVKGSIADDGWDSRGITITDGRAVVEMVAIDVSAKGLARAPTRNAGIRGMTVMSPGGNA